MLTFRGTHGILYFVAGENTSEDTKESTYGVWLSLARAPGLGPGGRRFESCHPDCFLKKEMLFILCGCSSVVEHQPSKLDMWVRFPSPAYARVAQLVERDLAKVEAAGSSPVSRFYFFEA